MIAQNLKRHKRFNTKHVLHYNQMDGLQFPYFLIKIEEADGYHHIRTISNHNGFNWKVQFNLVLSLRQVRPFVTSWITAHQASLSITNSQSSPRPMSIESVMKSNHLILCHPFSSCPPSYPASGSLQKSQLFASGSQSIGVSASASVLPMNTQDWSPLGRTCRISWQSKGLSTVNMLSRLVTFLPRTKHLFISWLQSPSAVILELPK